MSLLRKGVVGAVALVTLGLGAGVAGATLAGGTASAGTIAASGSKGQNQAAKHFNCANASRRLGHLQRVEARFNKTFARIDKHVAAATKKGDTKLVAYWQKVLAHQKRVESHVLSPKVKAKAAKADGMISAKCHVAAPATSSAHVTST